jgi:nucleoid-associated protein YgaU
VAADAEESSPQVALADPEVEVEQPFAPDANSGGDAAVGEGDTEGGEPDGPVTFTRPTVATAEDPEAEAPGADSDVSVGVIDYDQQGDVSIAGDAPAGAIVQVYLDNAVLGVTEAAPSGAWQLAPTQTVPPGPHQIRIDQIAPSGDVIARIELPFVRAAAVTEMPQDIYVVVEPGQSLWRIARRVYGEGIRYTEILAANRAQIADPNLIYPGQVFMIPRG